jgi:pyruvate dehydrogenase E2 component (dihydrolipoamide acetyltransferase)
MPVELRMPDLATTDSAITVTRWLVGVGQAVARGQPMLEVETDKAAMEVEAYLDGTLSEILAQPGDTVEAGQVIARLAIEAGQGVASAAPVAIPAAAAPVQAAPVMPGPARAKAGLFARNRQAAAVMSPHGAITPPDGAAAAPAQSAALPLSVAARTAALRLQESKQTIPHFYLQRSANAEPMRARRQAALPRAPVWDAFFVAAVARALGEYSKLACRWDNGQLVPQSTDSIGVAVDLEDELFVVSVPRAAARTPEDISDCIRADVDRLRRHDPAARRLSRNLMTVTNLGSLGVDAFAAIINPPEAAVLAVGRVAPAVVAVAGRPVVQERVTLTLSVDHRVASGRYAAAFLNRLVALLESITP